jgi:hypothetical protein
MIQEDLANQIFKNLSRLNLSPSTNNRDYYFKDTLKKCLLDSIGDSKIIIESSNKIKIEIKAEEFKTALFSDFHFGYIRIREQINNVNNLIASKSQVAWILITTYYACYFMAVEIAKLHGEFIINFSNEEFNLILSNSQNINNITVSSEVNNSFKVCVKMPKYENTIDLCLLKEGSKPHQIVWLNLFSIIKRLEINDNLLCHKNLLMDICDFNNNRWKFPSTIRNEWNYSYANYYSDRGTELGDTFLSIIKNSDSAMRWANVRKLQPNENNVTASIAYLYHCLSGTIEKIDSRFKQ